MLKRLIAHNFQIHKYVDIHFHSGVNIITGASEAGKSSIMRMIRWVTLNRPLGKSIVKKGESNTKVKLIFDNGVIRKKRKKEITTYNINGTVLKAIGKDLPKEVMDVSLVEDKNYQQQHNPYFLLVKSPGEVAKELNDLAGISVIDKLFTAINGELRKTKAELISVEEEIPELKAKLEETIDIEDLEVKVNRFAKLLKRNKQKQLAINAIAETISDIEDIDNEKQKNDKQLQHGDTIANVKKKIEKLLGKRKELDSITTHIINFEDVNDELALAKEDMEVLEKRKKKAMRTIEQCPLCGTLIRKE